MRVEGVRAHQSAFQGIADANGGNRFEIKAENAAGAVGIVMAGRLSSSSENCAATFAPAERHYS